MRTQIFRNRKPGIAGSLLRAIINQLSLSPEQGTDTAVFLAASPEVAHVTGQFFHKRKAVQTSALLHDEPVAKRLWQVSEDLTTD